MPTCFSPRCWCREESPATMCPCCVPQCPTPGGSTQEMGRQGMASPAWLHRLSPFRDTLPTTSRKPVRDSLFLGWRPREFYDVNLLPFWSLAFVLWLGEARAGGGPVGEADAFSAPAGYEPPLPLHPPLPVWLLSQALGRGWNSGAARLSYPNSCRPAPPSALAELPAAAPLDQRVL